jgi:hypothetical protein
LDFPSTLNTNFLNPKHSFFTFYHQNENLSRRARAGIPDADLCRSWLLMYLAAPEIADGYLVACERVAGITRRDALAWLPVVAGARLAEGTDEEAPALLAMAAAGIS